VSTVKINQTGAGFHADSRREAREARGASVRRALAEEQEPDEADGEFWTGGLCQGGDEEPDGRTGCRHFWAIIEGGGERYLVAS
jgi:hypothetical protein